MILLDTDEVVVVVVLLDVEATVEVDEEKAVDVDSVVEEALEENRGEKEVDAAVEFLVVDNLDVEEVVEDDVDTAVELVDKVVDVEEIVEVETVDERLNEIEAIVAISSVVTASVTVGAAFASTDTLRGEAVEISKSSVTIGAPGGFKTNVCLAMMMSSCSGERSRSDADKPNTPTSS